MADATAAILVPPLVRHIEATAPGVSLRVLPLTTRDPRALLEAGGVDMAVGYFPAVVAAIGLTNHAERHARQFSHALLQR